jgi:hypothetical protein
VDSSLLKTYSGSAASQIKGALKYFGLINEAGATDQRLTELVTAYSGTEWQTILGRVVSDAYREAIGDLELHVATRGQLEEKFKDAGVEGDVQRKCVTFFIAAAREGGMALSPHILVDRRGRPSLGRAKARKQQREQKQSAKESPDEPQSPAETIRFSIPVPGKASATIIVPSDVTAEDWRMLDVMMQAYIQRMQKPD